MSDLLRHRRGLHRRLRVLADGERTMVLHQHRRRLRILPERLDHALADRLGTDQTERPHRNRTSELVAHHRQTARNVLARRRPRRRVRRMRVHHAVHVRHVTVDVRVRSSIRAGRLRAVHHVAVQVAHHHARRGQVLVTQARRLDHHQIRSAQTLRHVASRPHHQVPLDQLLVQGRHDLTHLLDLRTHLGTIISQSSHNHFLSN